jgi:hypothetical protein
MGSMIAGGLPAPLCASLNRPYPPNGTGTERSQKAPRRDQRHCAGTDRRRVDGGEYGARRRNCRSAAWFPTAPSEAFLAPNAAVRKDRRSPTFLGLDFSRRTATTRGRYAAGASRFRRLCEIRILIASTPRNFADRSRIQARADRPFLGRCTRKIWRGACGALRGDLSQFISPRTGGPRGRGRGVHADTSAWTSAPWADCE